MLRFAVFNGAESARPWALRHAFLLGADDAPIAGEVRLEDGLIVCERRTPEAAALSVQFVVDPGEDGQWAGGVRSGGEERGGALDVNLQTCLLPDRERPYLLPLELARHRLMLTFNKLEDWALFDLPADDPVMVLLERARGAFTDALVAQTDEPGGEGRGAAQWYSDRADRSARRALSLAVDVSEALARRQAEIVLPMRLSGELAEAASVEAPENALTDHEAIESRNARLGCVGVVLADAPTVGCAIGTDSFAPELQRHAASVCDFICMPMRWVDMEPTEGRYSFTPTDRWIEWAVRHARMPIVAGPVIDFRPSSVPEWLYIWENDYETLRELVYDYVKQIVTRYRRTVSTWTVVSGLHVNTNFTFSLEQVLDLTRLCVNVARKLHSKAKIQIEIDQPWGDYLTSNPRSIPPLLYAEMLAQAGVQPDQYALRVEVGQPEPGRATRDLMALSALLDRYATLDVPLSVSALGAPSEPPEPEALGSEGQFDPGHWRLKWSERAQAEWMTQALTIAASKPYVRSVCWTELRDSLKHPSHAALISSSGEPKPALERLSEIRRAIKEKRAPAVTGVGG